jgi:hypothetical protein
VALGSVQSILVCQPVATATAQDQSLCPANGAQLFAPRVVSAYVLDPAQASSFEAAVGPFDYAYAAGIWAFAFSTVVVLFVMSNSIGHVLGMIRRG